MSKLTRKKERTRERETERGKQREKRDWKDAFFAWWIEEYLFLK